MIQGLTARWKGLLLLVGLLVAGAVPLRAQVLRKVEVRVTAVSGARIFIDKGRDAAIEPDDLLTLYPAGGVPVQARVQAVSRTTSSAEFNGQVGLIQPGTRGEIQVPEARLVPDREVPPQTGKPPPPEHPPWTRPLGAQDPSTPLLAPVSGRGPEDRPTRLRGRYWLNTVGNWNRGMVDQRYLLADVGTDLRVENPFGRAGELRLRGDVSHRRSYSDLQADTRTSRGRLDRLSYRVGHLDRSPVRYQLGRFLQTEFPEFGLVDGVEADVQTSRNHRLGFSAGAFPEPFVDQSTGQDVQAAAYWRYWAGEDKSFDFGAGLQKTWHKGDADRDLLVLNMYSRPTEDLSFHSSVWVDYYTSGDAIKSPGLELTEIQLSGTYALAPGHGVAVNLSRVRWPELKRDEFDPLTASQILDNRVLRVSGNTWHELSEHLRTTLRASYWDDQDRGGFDGEVGVSLRDLLYDQGSVDLTLFRTDGAFNDGYGARLSAWYYSGSLSLNGGYEIAEYSNDNSSIGAGDPGTLHALTGGLQWVLTESVDFSTSLDYRFGGSQDALTIGAFIQTHF